MKAEVPLPNPFIGEVRMHFLEFLEKPRYERGFTAADLFYQFSKVELVHNQNLEFLGHAGVWQHRPDIALPSWAAG